MNVKELIAKLEQLPPETIVLTEIADGLYLVEATDIEFEHRKKNTTGKLVTYEWNDDQGIPTVTIERFEVISGNQIVDTAIKSLLKRND